MKVKILGSGTSQGIPVIGCNCKVCLSNDNRDKRLRSSILVSTNDTHIIIDVGPDFRQQMLRSNTHHLDAIFITHEHNDHVAGLDDIRPFNFMSNSPMPIFALGRVAKDIKNKYAYIFGDSSYPGLPKVDLQVISSQEDTIVISDVKVDTVDILHGRLPILGFKLNSLVYLTDIKTISDIEIQKIKGCHTLIISTLRLREHHAHLNLEEALKIIASINPHKAYLTHISHDFDLHENIVDMLPHNVYVAFDEMEILVN